MGFTGFRVKFFRPTPNPPRHDIDPARAQSLLWLNPTENLNICIDKSLSKSNRDAFDYYVRNKASWIWDIELGRAPSLRWNQITTTHEDSEKECCIQLADFIAGATFQKYERVNEEYYRIFEDNVRGFNYLW